MRVVFLICYILNSSFIYCQPIREYYDYNWKPCTIDLASFYSTIESTDSGYWRKDYFIASNQLQMQALFEDPACKIHKGPYYYFYSNGNLNMSGQRNGSKYEGPCVSYWSNGMIRDSSFYQSGQKKGASLSWHNNGIMHDSSIAVNDTLSIYLSWHFDGTPAIGGYYAFGKKHGIWKYFHPNGQEAAELVYDHGRSISKKYFSENGDLLPDTATAKFNHDARFRRGGDDWLNYVYKNIYWPTGYKLENTDKVTVIVSFTVNEEGKVEDVEMEIPFYPEFDKIALEAIRKSPAWKPALLENTRIRDYYRQGITFTQE